MFKTWQQIKILPSTSNASNSSAKPIKSDNALIGRNEKKIAANLNSKLPLTRTLGVKERNGDLIVKNSVLSNADFSPLSTNYLRNLRLQRGNAEISPTEAQCLTSESIG